MNQSYSDSSSQGSKDKSPSKTYLSKRLESLKKHFNWSPVKSSNSLKTISDQPQMLDNPIYSKPELIESFFSVINPQKETVALYPLEEKIVLKRPHFLNLSAEEYTEAVNNLTRTVINPTNLLPLMSGYAECVNAGKTRFLNEDQASITQLVLTVTKPNNNTADGGKNSFVNMKIPYFYFGVFDGHAGATPAILAANRFHEIVDAKLNEIGYLLLENFSESKYDCLKHSPEFGSLLYSDALLIGTLQTCFQIMDKEVYETLALNGIGGGTTAVVALVIMGRLVISHAGDSQAGIYRDGKIKMITDPHTVDFDRKRCQMIARLRPDFLMNRISPLQYCRDLSKLDIGKEVLYRDYNMDGWYKKIVNESDIKPSLISSDGHSFRLMEVISTTRGFGDHLLIFETDDYTKIPIKPFMSNEPHVSILDYNEKDFLIMGTDGFWEYVGNDEIEKEISEILSSNNTDDDKLCTNIASRLVTLARGEPDTELLWSNKNKSRSSFDDITVIVIPLNGTNVSDLLLPPKPISKDVIKHQKRHGSVLCSNKQSYIGNLNDTNNTSASINDSSNENWDYINGKMKL